MMLNPEHLAFFKSLVPIGPLDDPPSRLTPRSWAAASGLGDALPAAKQNRKSLFELVAGGASTEVVCWSALAWGGMNGRHRNSFMAHDSREWVAVAEEVRRGAYSRGEAYGAFAKLRREKQLPGVGPAYFTKLIFFLMPTGPGVAPRGYIMDQWVGCSVNLLTDLELVLMDRILRWIRAEDGPKQVPEFMVSDANSSKQYEEYCQAVEAIGREIDRPADEAEFLLMSEGGHKPKAWREYVEKHRV